MRFILNLVSFLAKLCQNILSDLGIEGGFTQFILRSQFITNNLPLIDIDIETKAMLKKFKKFNIAKHVKIIG